MVGAVAAAVAMFILGFIFFSTPVANIARAGLDDNQAAAVQQSLAANLPATGTYFVPYPDTPAQNVMYSRGPIATVHYNSRGFATADPTVMVGGFIHFLVVALLMAAGLYTLSRYVLPFGEQMKLLILGVAGAVVFMRLRDPIWYHHGWGHAIYLLIADTVILLVAGFIILKLLPRTAPATATTEP
jgi:hypothetical protein